MARNVTSFDRFNPLGQGSVSVVCERDQINNIIASARVCSAVAGHMACTLWRAAPMLVIHLAATAIAG